MSTDLVAAIARIPLLARLPAGEIAVETLPGLTNRNYKITARGEGYVLRLPGAGTENYIDRAAEAHDAALAARADLTPEILMQGVLLGLVTAIVGAFFPALRAAAVPPVVAMRARR